MVKYRELKKKKIKWNYIDIKWDLKLLIEVLLCFIRINYRRINVDLDFSLVFKYWI